MKIHKTSFLFTLLSVYLILTACHTKRVVDLIVYDGVIYTVNHTFSISQAMAIKNGKIISIGNSADVLDDFTSSNTIDLKGKFVYPGFIDGHCHFYGYATDLLKCDVTGTNSFDEVIEKMTEFSRQNRFEWLLARGWDQNDWPGKQYPSKEKLDSIFPDIPVYLLRIDGHAALCNQFALDMSGIKADTKIEGGEIILNNEGQLTGLLIDNAIDLVRSKIPAFSRELIDEALLEAQKNCFAVGITSVNDAGLGKDSIAQLQSLQLEGKLKMRVYAMMSDDPETRNHFVKTGSIITDRLTVRAVKVYADGALGSRGACLKQAYSDKPGHYGFMLRSKEYLDEIARQAKSNGFQMCVHAIGDSSVDEVLDVYTRYVSGENNNRWRIEHCQVVEPKTMKRFGNNSIIPSVQPTHATSDMYWAEERLGSDRIKYAYAYNDLMQEAEGLIVLGTDFPVEKINPLHTFYAAVSRKDLLGNPPGGFNMENALTRKDALKGMTILAAHANFEEEKKGSLEEGKFADFVVLDKDIMTISDKKIPGVRLISTYLNGEKVFPFTD